MSLFFKFVVISIQFRAIIIYLLLLQTSLIHSEQPLFIGIDSPPYSFYQAGKPSGINVIFINHIKTELKLNYPIKIYPLKRALKEINKSPQALVYGLARSSAREDKFHWIAPMHEVKIGYVSYSKQTKVIKSYRAKYCVHEETPMESILIDSKITDYVKVTSEALCLEMLHKGMVEIWFTVFDLAQYYAEIKQIQELEFGNVRDKAYLYLATDISNELADQELLEKICLTTLFHFYKLYPELDISRTQNSNNPVNSSCDEEYRNHNR